MITCPKCSKENQDHYKFCLGCGAELPRDASPKAFSPQTPPHGMRAAQSAGNVAVAQAVPVAAPAAAPRPMAAPAAAPVASAVCGREEDRTALGLRPSRNPASSLALHLGYVAHESRAGHGGDDVTQLGVAYICACCRRLVGLIPLVGAFLMRADR